MTSVLILVAQKCKWNDRRSGRLFAVEVTVPMTQPCRSRKQAHKRASETCQRANEIHSHRRTKRPWPRHGHAGGDECRDDAARAPRLDDTASYCKKDPAPTVRRGRRSPEMPPPTSGKLGRVHGTRKPPGPPPRPSAPRPAPCSLSRADTLLRRRQRESEGARDWQIVAAHRGCRSVGWLANSPPFESSWASPWRLVLTRGGFTADLAPKPSDSVVAPAS